MRALQRVVDLVLPSRGVDWLAEAERLGDLKTEKELFGSGVTAQLWIGQYGDLRLQVWAVGNNTVAAVEAVVRKAKAVIGSMNL